MSTSYVDNVVEGIDWKLLREQKAYCVNEAENDSENGHIYEGLVHLLDELQTLLSMTGSSPRLKFS